MLPKPSVALLHYSCPPIIGGVEEILRQQAELFRRNHHSVKVFAGSGNSFSGFDVKINPLLSSTSKSVMKAHSMAKRGSVSQVRSLSSRIFSYLKRALSGFDILLAHNVLSMDFNLPLTLALRRLASESSLKVVAWNHDSPYFYDNYPAYLDKSPWSVLKAYSENISYVAISPSRKRQFAKLYSGSATHSVIEVIPDGVDPFGFLSFHPLTVRLVTEQNLMDADLVLIHPSRLHPRKNIEFSIKVTYELKKKGASPVLLVTGAHDPHSVSAFSYYKKLKRLVNSLSLKKNVIILAEHNFGSGEKLVADRTFIRDLYMIADALIMPSFQEGFGIPLLEAAVAKLPVFCSDIPPFREVGLSDVHLFSLRSSPSGVARRILNVISSYRPSRFFRRAVKQYSWQKIYEDSIIPFFDSLLR